MARREKRKARRPRKPNILEVDVEAREAEQTGSNKKIFHLKDLRILKPKTYAQEEAFHSFAQDRSVALIGAAGTGKTALSIYYALREVLDPSTPYHKVVIVRSPVQVREIGFTPGSEDEKAAVYESPYMGLCDELFPWSKSYENLKKAGKIEFYLTTFLRGKTFPDGTILIVDEAQNMTLEEGRTVITRLGNNSKLYLAGDSKQNDLTKRKSDQSGFNELLQILERMDSIDIIKFTSSDCVRSGLVREFLIAAEELGF